MSTPRYNHSIAAMAFLVFAYGVLQIFWGERVPIADGLGWDGQIYGAYASDFFVQLGNHGVNYYRAQRLLPSAIVYFSLSAVGAPHDIPSVIRGFQLLNLSLMVGAAVCYGLLCKKLRLRPALCWVGFFSL